MTDTLTREPRVKMATEATLRDYFAAKVLQNLCKNYVPAQAAHESYLYADAMLDAREETK